MASRTNYMDDDDVINAVAKILASLRNDESVPDVDDQTSRTHGEMVGLLLEATLAFEPDAGEEDLRAFVRRFSGTHPDFFDWVESWLDTDDQNKVVAVMQDVYIKMAV